MTNILELVGFSITIAFYAYCVIALFVTGLIMLYIHDDTVSWASVLVLVGVLLYAAVNILGIPISNFKNVSPLNFLIYFSLYLFVGLVWSIVKWYLANSQIKQAFDDHKFKFLERDEYQHINLDFLELKPIDDETLKANYAFWRGLFSELGVPSYFPVNAAISFEDGMNTIKPKFENNRENIRKWIIIWPFSMIHSLLNEFLHDLVNLIMTKLRGMYNAISNAAFK